MNNTQSSNSSVHSLIGLSDKLSVGDEFCYCDCITDYNQYQRIHNLTLPMAVNDVLKPSFVYRMVFRNTY